MNQTMSKFKLTATTATSEISSFSSKTTSTTSSTTTKPNTTTFAAVSKKDRGRTNKSNKVQGIRKNYSWSRWDWRIICLTFIWRYQWNWFIWVILVTHNKLSPRQFRCPYTTIWKYWETKRLCLCKGTKIVEWWALRITCDWT